MENLKTDRKTGRKTKTIKVPTGNIDKDFDILSEFATSKIMNKESIEPTLFIIDSKKKEMGVISGGDLPYDGEVKQKIFEHIGEDYAEKMPGADAFIMMMEAWASSSKGPNPVLQPHEDPNRIEIFMVTAKRLDGAEKSFAQAFKRDNKTGKAELLDRDDIPNLNMDWAQPVEKDGFKMENRLLTALWKKFMFTKIVNNLK